MISQSLRILHIDPEPEITTLVKATLKNTAHVDGCQKYYKANEILLKKYKKPKYNMIILEIFGSKASDGFNLIKKLRQYNIDIPFIVVSLCQQTIYKLQALRMGAEGYFTKPFNPEELQVKVRLAYLKYAKTHSIVLKKRVIKIKG